MARKFGGVNERSPTAIWKEKRRAVGWFMIRKSCASEREISRKGRKKPLGWQADSSNEMGAL